MLYVASILVQALIAHGWNIAVPRVPCLLQASKGEGESTPRAALSCNQTSSITPRAPLSCNQTQLKTSTEWAWGFLRDYFQYKLTQIHPSLKKSSQLHFPPSGSLAYQRTLGPWSYHLGHAETNDALHVCSLTSARWTLKLLVLSPANISITNNHCQPKRWLLLLPLHMSSSLTNNRTLDSGCCWRLDKQLRG